MDTHKKIREHISAFADDALPPADACVAMAALQSADGQATWSLYHRIGDALRASAGPDLSPGFGAALAARLTAEPLPARRAAPTEAPLRPAAPVPSS